MDVLHVVAGVEEGGGVGQSVPRLCRALAEQGHRVTLSTVDWRVSEAARAAQRAGVRLVLMRRSRPWRLWFSWDMLVRLPALVRSSDLVHVHASWTFPVWWASLCAVIFGKPRVMSPRGCLSPERMRRSLRKKRLAGGCFDRRCLRGAQALHATCEAERREIEAYLGGPGARLPRIAVIPNGADADEWRAAPDRDAVGQRWPACSGKRILLFMGRLDPIKGLDLLVEAWARVAEQAHALTLGRCDVCGDGRVGVRQPEERMASADVRSSPWHLLIAGPDESGYAAQVQDMIDRAGMGAQATLCGPVYGADKRAVLNAADLFVLPTYNENFGNAVAEALACGVPVITTKGAPWQELLGSELNRTSELSRGSELSENGKASKLNAPHALGPAIAANGRCGWWVEVGVEPLAEALREAMGLTDEERHAMGENGRRLVEARYRWQAVSGQMAALYQALEAQRRKQ